MRIVIRDKKFYVVINNVEKIENPEGVDYTFQVKDLRHTISSTNSALKTSYTPGLVMRWIIKILSTSTDIECVRISVKHYLELMSEQSEEIKLDDDEYSKAGFINRVVFGVPIISGDLEDTDPHLVTIGGSPCDIFYKSTTSTPEEVKSAIKARSKQ
jgi:hypothetical protein